MPKSGDNIKLIALPFKIRAPCLTDMFGKDSLRITSNFGHYETMGNSMIRSRLCKAWIASTLVKKICGNGKITLISLTDFSFL